MLLGMKLRCNEATSKSQASVAVPGSSSPGSSSSWKVTASKLTSKAIGVDSILWMMRFYRQLILWQTVSAVTAIQALSTTSNYIFPPSISSSNKSTIVPESWEEWAQQHKTAAQQAKRLRLAESWIRALFDVHGHQIFHLGLFNADPHTGNILVIEQEDDNIINNNATSVAKQSQHAGIHQKQTKHKHHPSSQTHN